MKAKIYITLKRGIHDPQGHAIHQSLTTLGFEAVNDVRLGKLLEVDIEEPDQEKAEATVQGMCKKLLANPVIENYRYELSSS